MINNFRSYFIVTSFLFMKNDIFESGFQRDTSDGKICYDLIPHELLTRLAQHYTNGANKYGENNWRKANSEVEFKRFKRCAFRHFMAWLRGDKGEDHAIALVWNVMSYEWHTQHKDVDSSN